MANDIKTIKDVSIQKNLKFPSDHRAVGLEMYLPKRGKIADAIKNLKSYKNVISGDKTDQAKQEIREKLKNSKVITEKLVQPMYNKIMEIKNKVVEKFSENDTEANINDKLSPETKSMCRKRNELAGKMR